MSYTPPLSEQTARTGLIKLVWRFTSSFLILLIVVVALWSYKRDYAAISAIFGLFSSFFALTSNNYINPRNQLVDVVNQPGIKKYIWYTLIINYVPIILSIVFLIVYFFTR